MFVHHAQRNGTLKRSLLISVYFLFQFLPADFFMFFSRKQDIVDLRYFFPIPVHPPSPLSMGYVVVFLVSRKALDCLHKHGFIHRDIKAVEKFRIRERKFEI